jgi:serine/threonine protein kinase/formylglycine-generating enzyme required for sulfatase activity
VIAVLCLSSTRPDYDCRLDIKGAIGVPVQIPGYVIHRELGSGGMAKVFLATQTSLDRQVALKIMSPALAADPTFAKRFQREARTIAALSHPNIAAVYEVGSVQHLHFFAMQFLGGGDLSSKLKVGVAETELAKIIIGVARALGFAHSKGIVHRDVTPGNILFDQADHPILTDFGIARSQHGATKITHTGVSIGTSSYMSPEQARGGEVDGRSDLYSLGALLFESLSGKPPYVGVDGFAVAYAHVFEPVPRLPGVLKHWQPIIDRAMAKAQEDRFANAEEIIEAISALPLQTGLIVPNRAEAALPPMVPCTDPELKTQSMMLAKAEEPKKPAAKVTPVKVKLAPVAPKRPWATWLIAGGALSLIAVSAIATRGFGLFGESPSAVVLVPTQTTSDAGSAATGAQLASVTDTTPPQDTQVSPPVITSDETSLSDQGSSGEPIGEEALSLPQESDPTQPEQTAEAAAEVVVLPFDPNNPKSFTGPPTRADFAERLFVISDAVKSKGQWVEPRNANVIDLMRYAAAVDPNNPGIKPRVLEAAAALAKQADEKHQSNDLAAAKGLLDRAETIVKPFGPKEELAGTFKSQRDNWLKPRLASATQAERAWQVESARKQWMDALLIAPELAEASAGLKRLEQVGKPGFRFKESLKAGGDTGFYRVIKASAVALRDDRDGSIRAEVSKSFAIAEREVSVGDYRRFVRATSRPQGRKGCNDREGFSMFTSKDRTFESPGFTQNDAHPVTCVSHADAVAYARWLTQQSGRNFRLPSEPEWRLAAGNLGTGECSKANVGDQHFAEELKGRDTLPCRDGYAGTAPSAKFPVGPNNLFDMAGNVREWVQDCYTRSVLARGPNGSPFETANCRQRLALGTTWISGTDERNAQPRLGFDPDDLNNTVGFRLVMELPNPNL